MLTLFARTLRLGQPIALDWNEGSTGLLPRRQMHDYAFGSMNEWRLWQR